MLYSQHNLFPDSKGHWANMGTTWVLLAPDGPHVGPMNLAIRVVNHRGAWSRTLYISKERTMYCAATNLGHAGLLLLQYIPRNIHTVFALLCFVVVIHWLIFPYPSDLLHWHCGNLTIAPVPAKQPWWIWINTSCEFIMNDCITTTKQSTTKPCAYFLGYTVHPTENYSSMH